MNLMVLLVLAGDDNPVESSPTFCKLLAYSTAGLVEEVLPASSKTISEVKPLHSFINA